jgi:hypothetical protein
MLRTRIPRGRAARRFKFDPLTEREIEALQSVPSDAAAHLASAVAAPVNRTPVSRAPCSRKSRTSS